MKLKEYTAAQRHAWNEVAHVHEASQFEKLLAGFKKSGFSCLSSVETQLLQSIELKGKSVIQLACNNGRELLSIKNLGAGRCVGLDIADEFIKQAQTLANTANSDCEFKAMDVYDIPASYNNQFDLVYITIGAICWMPDLTAFFAIISRLLKSGGHVLIYDMHPFLSMLSEHNKTNSMSLVLSYFRTEPILDSNSLDYYTQKNYEAAPRWWFHYKLSDIFSTALTHHLNIVSFKEYAHDISNVYGHLENQPQQLPLSYILLLQKA